MTPKKIKINNSYFEKRDSSTFARISALCPVLRMNMFTINLKHQYRVNVTLVFHFSIDKTPVTVILVYIIITIYYNAHVIGHLTNTSECI